MRGAGRRKRTIGNNANGNNKIKMLISINLLKKIKILIVYLHEFMKKKQRKVIVVENWKQRTQHVTWKNETSEQTKKFIMFGDSIWKTC